MNQLQLLHYMLWTHSFSGPRKTVNSSSLDTVSDPRRKGLVVKSPTFSRLSLNLRDSRPLDSDLQI